ncbi:MAG: DMT family transporter [Chloroflexota bacterium]|nr:DMT family transporter [Chloroflexota bacterium]
MAEIVTDAPSRAEAGAAPVTAYLQLAVAMTTVGSSAVVGKAMAESLPIFFASALRFALAAAILLPLLLRATGGVPRVTRRDVRPVGVQALTGVFGFSVFWLCGLRQTTAAEAGIVASTTPAAIALASFVLLGERPRRRQLTAVALAVVGVGAMTAFGESSAARGPNPPLGNLLILGAVAGEALFLVLGKRTGARLSPLAIATGVTVAGFLLFLPPAIPEAAALDLAAVPVSAWLAVAYYGLGPTVLGYLLLYRGLARVPAGSAAAFIGVVPLSAVLLAALILGEPIGWPHLVGLIGVLAAIALTIAGSR